MLKLLSEVPVAILLAIATVLEVGGDSVVRLAMYNHTGSVRFVLFLAGAALLFGYGTLLNASPLDFGRLVGIYIATFFVVWQVITFIVFRAAPTLPIMLGGALIVAGGTIVTFWERG